MIEKALVLEDEQDREGAWHFYEEIFRPINEESPIVQSFPRQYFMEWLVNPRVTKYIAKNDRRIVGLAAFTDDLNLEPLLSPAYFRKHYPDGYIIYCPVLAVSPSARGMGMGVKLVRAMLRDGPENGMLVFLHSKTLSLGLPRLFNLAGAGCMEGREVDSEACWIYLWSKGKKVLPLSTGDVVRTIDVFIKNGQI